jgi:hypothetical protein
MVFTHPANGDTIKPGGSDHVAFLDDGTGVVFTGWLHVLRDGQWITQHLRGFDVNYNTGRNGMAVDKDLGLWYAGGRFLIRYDTESGLLDSIAVRSSQHMLTVDDQGVVWYATGEGLGRWRPQSSESDTFKVPLLTNIILMTLHFTPDGEVWGLDSQGRILRATLVEPSLRVPEAIVFDDGPTDLLPEVGSHTTQDLYIVNAGEGQLRVRQVELTGEMFSLFVSSRTENGKRFDDVGLQGTIRADDSLRFVIAYRPTSAGAHTGTLTLITDDPERLEQRITLSGATLGSIGPNLEAPATVRFDTVLTFEDQSKSIRLRNTGTGLLTVTSVTSDSPVFTLDAVDSFTVRPGEWADVGILFAPRDGGFQQGRLLIESDDPATPVTEIILEGVGFQLPEGPITIDFHLAAGDQGRRTAGNATVGQVFLLQLNVAAAPEISGWSAKIEYDSAALAYVGSSFTVSDFIPSLIGLVDDTETGLVSVGGSILGDGEGRSGDGTLALLSFGVLEGFQGESQLHITEISFRRTDDTTDKRTVRATATITSGIVDVGLSADFNGDGGVDFDDFFIFADGFGGSDPLVDLDRSGTVDFDDFFIFADQFGQEERAKLMALAVIYLGLPRETALLDIYPNPFNASTIINYSLSAQGNVRLDIYDLAGQRIDTLVNGLQIAGGYQVRWSGADVSSGVYVVRLRIGEAVRAQKVTLIK